MSVMPGSLALWSSQPGASPGPARAPRRRGPPSGACRDRAAAAALAAPPRNVTSTGPAHTRRSPGTATLVALRAAVRAAASVRRRTSTPVDRSRSAATSEAWTSRPNGQPDAVGAAGERVQERARAPPSPAQPRRRRRPRASGTTDAATPTGVVGRAATTATGAPSDAGVRSAQERADLAAQAERGRRPRLAGCAARRRRSPRPAPAAGRRRDATATAGDASRASAS